MPDEPSPKPDPSELLGYKEIGKMLKVHPKTVRRWDRLGIMPRASFQVSGFRRWRRDVVEAWIFIGGSRMKGTTRDKREQKPDGKRKQRSRSEQKGTTGVDDDLQS